MASPEATLPYIFVDPSMHLRSLFDIYDIIQDSKPFDWSSLLDKAIKDEDLFSLVVSIGLLLDSHVVHKHPANYTRWTKEFGCPTCTQFRLVFKCSKPRTRTANAVLPMANQFLLKSQESTHSADCPISTCVTDSCMLLNLPSLLWQIRTVELEPQSAGRSLLMVDVTSNLQIQQLWTSLKKSTIHRVLEKMRTKYRREVGDSYIVLPQFLRTYSDVNPEALVALQVDNEDCFMRLFVTIPRFNEIFSKLCFPMLHIDGAHSKCTLYDGVLILIVAKLGNGAQLHLGLAHVPVESGLHMVWIILLLIRGGLDVSSVPIFSDRGNLLAASRILSRDHGIILSLKFCLEHLIRNVVSRFTLCKLDSELVRSMQSSPTIDIFAVATNRMMALHDQKLGAAISAYLLQIHPIHWTVFGNRRSQLEENWMPLFQQLVALSLASTF